MRTPTGSTKSGIRYRFTSISMMDFLSFTLSMGEHRAIMPDVPLYMDALLSQDIDFDFRANDIFINGKKVLVK